MEEVWSVKAVEDMVAVCCEIKVGVTQKDHRTL